MKTARTTILGNSAIEPINRDVIRAAKDGDVQLLWALLHHEVPAKVMINALCYSVFNSHLPCCRLLLDNGADVNGIGLYGSSPLSTAASRLDAETADLLLQRGAQVNLRNESAQTPLFEVCRRDGQTLEHLGKAEVDEKRMALAKKLISAGADVNATDEIGRTPLLEAILNFGNMDLLRLLLEAGADPNIADKRGLTPLWATMLDNGNPDVMRLHLKYGADAAVPYFGKLLIDVARKNGLNDFVNILTVTTKSKKEHD